MRACNGSDQLTCDANFPGRLPHRPLNDIAHAKRTPDFLDIDRSALEGEARITSDYEQRFEPRKRCNDFLNHPIRKILLFRVAAHVLERQHGDGRLVGQREGLRSLGRRFCYRRRAWADAHAPSPHRFGDILESLGAHILSGALNLATNLPDWAPFGANGLRQVTSMERDRPYRRA